MNWQTPSQEAGLGREGDRQGDSQKRGGGVVQSEGRGIVQCAAEMETKCGSRLTGRKQQGGRD